MRDFDDDLERVIGAQFGALHGGVAAAVPLPGTEEIIARGRRRRRNGQAALGGLAVLGIVAVAWVLFGPLRPDGAPVPPVNPTPTAPAYLPPPGAARAPLGGTIPAGFLPGGLPGKGVLKPLCPGPAMLSTNASIVASSSTMDGTVSLVLYPAGMTASRAYQEYRGEAERCAGPSRTVEPLTFGAEGFTMVTARPAHHLAVVRYGRSLLLVGGSTADAVRKAGAIERRLCVFATDCSARGGLPGALPSLSVAGPAWAVVLATSASAEDPLLGNAVAKASELGYRTSVTSVDCDDRARQAFGLPVGSAQRYVPVYFASRADAERLAEVARSLTAAPPAIIEVRTYCLG